MIYGLIIVFEGRIPDLKDLRNNSSLCGIFAAFHSWHRDHHVQHPPQRSQIPQNETGRPVLVFKTCLRAAQSAY